jgi:VWFA-related protein
MMRHTSWLLIAMLVLGCLPISGALAQQPPGELTVQIDGANVANYPEVALSLVVRDAFGRVVTDLTTDAFEIFEDDNPAPHRALDLERVLNRDLPVHVVVAVDASGSMQGRPMMDARAAARAFIEQMNPGDVVGLIGFKVSVQPDTVDERLEHRPTTDHAAVLEVVDRLRAAGGTPLYDALNKAVQWALQMPPFNRAIVLFTDGVDEDPGSTVGPDVPVEAAARANIPVFTIGFQGIGGRLARDFLQAAADATGGSYQETPIRAN